MSDDLVKQSIAELQDIVHCDCAPAYLDRGLHSHVCLHYMADALKIVADRIEELEAKLKKAVGALTFYSCKGNCDCLPGYEADPLCGWNAHVALAAIKENDNG